jgi:hypothetical protein
MTGVVVDGSFQGKISQYPLYPLFPVNLTICPQLYPGAIFYLHE